MKPVRCEIEMEGRTRTDFVIAAALERAQQVIEQRKNIRLALQDQELLAASLLEDRAEEPPRHVKGIAQEYAARVVNDKIRRNIEGKLP